ncbi:MAG: hypothetical protein IKK00_06110 [Oscillospiraceae bacterium]|nr:hypothetical protein [Oscillospiraceae bacterium]
MCFLRRAAARRCSRTAAFIYYEGDAIDGYLDGYYYGYDDGYWGYDYGESYGLQ